MGSPKTDKAFEVEVERLLGISLGEMQTASHDISQHVRQLATLGSVKVLFVKRLGLWILAGVAVAVAVLVSSTSWPAWVVAVWALLAAGAVGLQRAVKASLLAVLSALGDIVNLAADAFTSLLTANSVARERLAALDRTDAVRLVGSAALIGIAQPAVQGAVSGVPVVGRFLTSSVGSALTSAAKTVAKSVTDDADLNEPEAAVSAQTTETEDDSDVELGPFGVPIKRRPPAVRKVVGVVHKKLGRIESRAMMPIRVWSLVVTSSALLTGIGAMICWFLWGE